jgi:hypothetical protein
MAREAAAIVKAIAARSDHQLTAEPAAPEMVETVVMMGITTTVAETTPTRRKVGRRVVTATAGTAPKSIQNPVRAAAQVDPGRTKATGIDQGV